MLFAAFFCAAVLLLFAITYIYATKYAAQGEIAEIEVEFARMVGEARVSQYALLPDMIAKRLRERGSEHSIYLLQDRFGHKLAGNMPAMTPVEGGVRLNRPDKDKKPYVVASGHTLENGDFLLIGEDLVLLEDMDAVLIRSFSVSIAATVLLALVCGLLISRNVLRRVASVSATSRSIIAGDMSTRIPLRGVDDEFDHLAKSVNDMLERIEDLMQHTQQVANDIAHDLRTPLTRLRQRLDRARRRDPADDVRHEVLDRSIEEVDAILNTFSALLRIAQIQAGGTVSSTNLVDLSQLLESISEDFVPAARDGGRTLHARIAAHLTVNGDRELLTQMVVNLLDNAILHSTPGAQISVTAQQIAGAPQLVIADTGQGIPQEERAKVFRPFYRIEPSRQAEGSGLGLSLVAAIVNQHRASISLEDNLPGLRVVVVFPSSSGIPARFDAGENDGTGQQLTLRRDAMVIEDALTQEPARD
jgi:signal transduction histidine kinase